MKFFVVFACALAAATAGHVSPVVYAGQHPLIGTNGVPVDTAAVQQARAEHLVHKVDAHLRNGDYAVTSPVLSAYATPVVSTYSAPFASTYASPFFAHLRKRRGVFAPVSTYSALSAPLAYSAVPSVSTYSHSGLVASTYSHTPLVSTYSTPVVAHGVHAVHYRKRRGLVAPVAAYSAVGTPLAYSSTPVVSTYAQHPLVAGIYPHGQVVASTYAAHPVAYSTPLVHHY